MKEKFIFDCDNTMGLPFKEVDDGLTLLYLLGLTNCDLLGITTTFGNGSIEQVFSQTSKLVTRLSVDIPVLKGQGADGEPSDSPAAEFLVKMVNRYPHEISLLATGPLGNIEAAANLDPTFYQKVNRIVTMGGYLKPVILGRRDLGELNFSANPQASLSVLNAPCPVIVFSAQVCLDAPYRFRDIIRATYWPFWIRITLLQWLLTFGYHTGEFVFYLWDLLPAVFLSNPKIFEFLPFPLGSTLSDLKRGYLIKSNDKNGRKIELATKIKDRSTFYNHLNIAWQQTVNNHNL